MSELHSRKPKTVGTTIYFTVEEMEDLKVLSSGVGIPISEIVRKSVRPFIEQNKRYLEFMRNAPTIEL